MMSKDQTPTNAQDLPSWTLNSRLFDEERMYAYLQSRVQSLGLPQTLAALPFAREKHRGQVRKASEPIPYIIHPLTLACHALAMNLTDDDLLAALLLHDVVEDTGTPLSELPVGDRVREIVALVSYNTYPGEKEAIKAEYYAHIAGDATAALVKCIDRCNNLSGMADGFDRGKMASYIRQTEKDILPLLGVVKAEPAYNSAAWLLRYQMTALLEMAKRML